MAVPFSNTKLRVPPGFPNLLEGLAREVLRHQPKDIYGFGAKYFEELYQKREGIVSIKLIIFLETGVDDLAQLAAKLDDRYYNNRAFCSNVCSINNPQHQDAAVCIQSEYRRHIASKETEQIRQINAATKIQAHYRGYRDRKNYDFRKSSKEKPFVDEILLKEETHYSPSLGVPSAPLDQETIELENQAAIKIQSTYRGYLVRKNHSLLNKIVDPSQIYPEEDQQINLSDIEKLKNNLTESEPPEENSLSQIADLEKQLSEDLIENIEDSILSEKIKTDSPTNSSTPIKHEEEIDIGDETQKSSMADVSEKEHVENGEEEQINKLDTEKSG